MARLEDRFEENVPGEFYVDRTCINCDTCRQLAPQVFADEGRHSYVHAQPAAEGEWRAATRALLSCPTASIGTEGKPRTAAAMDDFPMAIDDGVYYLGFNSHKSRGANSYLIVRAGGNWMVDAPRWSSRVAAAIEALGGLAVVFYTCRANRGDGGAYAGRFRAEERGAGEGETQAGEDLRLLPTPGAVPGHGMLLFGERSLFSGDLLAWDRTSGGLVPSQEASRYRGPRLARAVAALRGVGFEWLLPAHGQRVKLVRQEAVERLEAFLATEEGAGGTGN